ncbi:MAG: hypothetical protein KC912_16700 [Proteobacteria bacterium]|nr:hypothetical protein [Pseudomonadota bacterium]
MKRLMVRLGFVALVVGQGLAQAQETPDGWSLSEDGALLVSPAGVFSSALPCAPEVWTQAESRAWLACGTEVFEVEALPEGRVTVSEPVDAGGTVVGWVVREGEPWAQVSRVRPLDELVAGADPSNLAAVVEPSGTDAPRDSAAPAIPALSLGPVKYHRAHPCTAVYTEVARHWEREEEGLDCWAGTAMGHVDEPVGFRNDIRLWRDVRQSGREMRAGTAMLAAGGAATVLSVAVGVATYNDAFGGEDFAFIAGASTFGLTALPLLISGAALRVSGTHRWGRLKRGEQP